MADELTATGLAIDSLEDRKAAVKALVRAAISPNLDLSPDQPSGQFVEIFCERIQAALELLRGVHSSMDPDAATGSTLTALSVLTGTPRRAATKGTVTLTVKLDAGITLPAGNVASVSGNPTNRWVTTADATNPGGAPANVNVAAECETAGPIQALAGTITVIATPFAGWNTVTNVADAVEGLAEETDTELRLRRELELAISGSTTVDAIRADLLELTGMISVTIYENDGDFVDANSVPSKTFEAVIWDDAAVANADIAETIFEGKAAGIRAYGATIVSHVDEQGNSHAVGFTRATERRVLVEITLDDGPDYVGDAAVATAIETWAADNLGVGDDVYRSKISGAAIDLQGVENVSLVRLSFWPAAVGAADLVVTIREIATIAAGDVTVIS